MSAALPSGEEFFAAIGGALSMLVIYFLPALSAAPQPVQGSVQLLVTALFVYGAGWLPKPPGTLLPAK